MAEGLLESLSAVNLGPTARLHIERSAPLVNSLCFKNHRTIGSFAIDGEKNYVRGQEPPTIRLPGKLTNLNIDLNTGFDKAVLITSYTGYTTLKREYFFRWLLEEYVASDGGPLSHDFVGFCGRFADILETPLIGTDDEPRSPKWSMYAVKFNGSIFLSDDLTLKIDDRSNYPYYGHRFRHILTSPNPDTEVVNEFSKAFVIRASDFGQHKLLCLREMDAMNENKDYVELKVGHTPWHHETMISRRRRSWAQCVPAGVETIAFGLHSPSGILKKIDFVRAKGLTNTTAGSWSPSTSYEFADRLLTWMARHLVDDDPTVVKKFNWCVGMKEVEVEDMNVDSPVIPQWFVDGVAAKSLPAFNLRPTARLPIKRSAPLVNSLCFKNFKTLGSFGIDKAKNCVRGQEPPTIRLPGKLTNLNIDLKKGLKEAVIISNFIGYKNLKREFFFKWLLEEYLTTDGGPFAHDFVGNCNRFGEILETPLIGTHDEPRNPKWSMYAVKFNGSIFLSDDLTPKPSMKKVKPLTKKRKWYRGKSDTYYRQRFRHILTCPDPDGEIVDEFSRSFVIRESEFGNRKLLCLREMDAMNENNDYVKLKVHERPWYSKILMLRRRHDWTQCVPAGVEALAFALRSRRGILEKIHLVKAKGLTNTTAGSWSPSICYEFADRLLTWMASHLVDDDPTVVKRFHWRIGMNQVEVEDVNVDSPVIPQWFVDGVAAKRKATA